MGIQIRKPRLTIQVKYLTLIAAVVLATSLVLSTYYYYAVRNQAIAELQAKGSTLTTNLAVNSEEGVLFSDTSQLNLLITLLRNDPDVVGAEIISADEITLESNAEDMRFLNPLDANFAVAIDEPSDATGIEMRQYRVLDKGFQLLEFTVPIVSRRIARDREEIGLMFEDEANAAQGGEEIQIGSARVILSSARSFGELQNIQRNIVLITIAVVLAGILLTIPLVRISIRPIRQLAEGTRKIAEGDLSQRVIATSSDEVGELAESFNQMAVDLEKYHEELMQHSRTLEERVRERTNELKKSNDGLALANAELRKAQAQLIQAGKMAAMGEFGAGVAHELNQPLSGIKGYTQLLLTMVSDDSPLKSRLVQIDKQASRMKEITQTMWNLARQSKFEYSFIDVRNPIRDSLILISEQFRQHQIDILSDMEDVLPRVYGDANQLHQVFLNFLTNAKDAFDENEAGTVRINVSPIADMRYVEVLTMDNGNGIAPDIISEVFNPFFTTKAPGKGTGLGLSINFSIIEQHHGFINVYSEQSVGSVFSVVLPTEKFVECSKNGKETEGHAVAPCWISEEGASDGAKKRKHECDGCETYLRFQTSPESSLKAKFRQFIAECSSASSES
jgi:signal transduction histidine kinase